MTSPRSLIFHAALAAFVLPAAAMAQTPLVPTPSVIPVPAAAPPIAPCPYIALAQMLSKAPATGIKSALSVERDILALCIARAEHWAKLLEGERRLAKMTAPPPPSPPEPVEALTEIKATIQPAEAEPAPPPAPLPQLKWFTIAGVSGSLRAGITDGSDIWFVIAGDNVPGGATVKAIRSRPPAVTLSDGRRLPWLGAPPGEPPSPAVPASQEGRPR